MAEEDTERNNKDYLGIPTDKYFTDTTEVAVRFLQVPKLLLENPFYSKLAPGPMLMYALFRDRLDLSIKNNWKDGNGYYYLIFSREEISKTLHINKETATKYKRILLKHKLISEKRVGQGKPNILYVLRMDMPKITTPVDSSFQKTEKPSSRKRKFRLQENGNSVTIDTYVNHPDLNNVKEGKKPPPVENSINNNEIKNQIEEQIELDIGKKLPNKNKKSRSPEKESLAKEILSQMGDEHSLGFYRKVVDLVPEAAIWRTLSIVKDTFLQGNIKKSKGALFTTTIKEIALEQNIKL